MRCSATRSEVSAGQVCGAERCMFSSVLTLGALFGLMVSPCARAPLFSAFIVVGIPLLTFLVAAPSRLGMFGELRLFVRDAQAGLLGLLCLVTGRSRQAATLVDAHRVDVEAAYAAGLGAVIAGDPLRLHHARRLAMLGASLAVLAGVGLPFMAGDIYTFGAFPEAPLVFLTDVIVIGFAARLVTERIALRLFEAAVALAGGGAWAARMRTAPLTAMLGAALGAVGGLVVLSAAAFASGVESVAVLDADFARAGVWFLRQTAPMALSLGIGIGTIVGAGVGLAQSRR